MITTDVTTDEDAHSISDRSQPYAPENKAEVNVPELCVDPEAGLALTPSVNHVRRRDLEALTSNGKLHKRCGWLL